jgi:ferredoxin-NADP reductase
MPGDELELRRPVGGYFVWEEALGGQLLMVAGGWGVVPFRAMVPHRSAAMSSVPARLLYSTRSLEDLIYRDELLNGDEVDVRIALTRQWPDDWQGYRGRIDRQVLEEVASIPDQRPLVYVCGPTPFAEAVAESLVHIGHEPGRIRIERFGPTRS